LFQVPYRPASELRPSVPSRTAFELAQDDQKTFELPGYPAITVGPSAFILVGGESGQGKSTWAARMAAKAVPSAFFSFEMGVGAALGELCRMNEIREKRLRFYEGRDVRDVFGVAEQEGLACLVIDSLTASTITASDCVALAKGNGILVVALVQLTKDGGFAGKHDIVHAADVVLCVTALKWQVQKNRFAVQEGLVGEVLS
jgi:predicted ATP-dependent serine protease